MLGNAPAAGAPPAAPRRGRPAPFTPSTSSTFAAGGATITADVANNALVIMAPEPVYNNLRAIIEKLDVRRAQVFVEALICEVSADKAAEFGIQWQALSGYQLDADARHRRHQLHAARQRQQHHRHLRPTRASVGQGLALGVMKGTVTIPGLGVITNLAFLARALETQVNANILSTPTLLTLDNEEARILVGQNIPILTGSYATTGSTTTVTPFQTFERKDIGLMLRVKPQITEGGTVRLVVYQEVSRDRPHDHRPTAPAPVHIEARARVLGRDRRQPDRRAGRAHRRSADRRLRQRSAAGPDPDRGRAVPLRRAAPGQDQPARVPEADRRAHGVRRPARSRPSATTT